MFWRMVRRLIFRQKGKMLMIAFTIALGVSLATAMINVMLGVGDKVNRELKIYGANITVMHKDASLLGDLYGLRVNDKYLLEEDILKIKNIFWGFNIVDFAPFLEQEVTLEGFDTKVKVIGTWSEKRAKLSTGEELDTGSRNLRNWWEYELRGTWMGDNPDNVMVGSLLAARAGIEPGDDIVIKNNSKSRKLHVTGVYVDGGVDDEKLYAELSVVQDLCDLQGKYDKMEVSALTTPDNDLARKAAQDPKSLSPDEYETWYCTAYVSAICHQIQEVVTDGVAKPVRQVAESEGTILNKVTLLMTLITILSSVGAALGISNLVTASVIERRLEIGLLKAIGAYDLPIIMMLITEIFITGILGGVLGYFMGIGFAQIIGKTVFGSYIEIVQMVIPIVSVLVFVVIVIGSIPAIRYLLNLKPTEVLHGK